MDVADGDTNETAVRYRPEGVRAVAERAVSRCAFDELPVFESVADDFFAKSSMRPGKLRHLRLVENALLDRCFAKPSRDVIYERVSPVALTLATMVTTDSLEAFDDSRPGGVLARLRRVAPASASTADRP